MLLMSQLLLRCFYGLPSSASRLRSSSWTISSSKRLSSKFSARAMSSKESCWEEQRSCEFRSYYCSFFLSMRSQLVLNSLGMSSSQSRPLLAAECFSGSKAGLILRCCFISSSSSSFSLSSRCSSLMSLLSCSTSGMASSSLDSSSIWSSRSGRLPLPAPKASLGSTSSRFTNWQPSISRLNPEHSDRKTSRMGPKTFLGETTRLGSSNSRRRTVAWFLMGWGEKGQNSTCSKFFSSRREESAVSSLFLSLVYLNLRLTLFIAVPLCSASTLRRPSTKICSWRRWYFCLIWNRSTRWASSSGTTMKESMTLPLTSPSLSRSFSMAGFLKSTLVLLPDRDRYLRSWPLPHLIGIMVFPIKFGSLPFYSSRRVSSSGFQNYVSRDSSSTAISFTSNQLGFRVQATTELHAFCPPHLNSTQGSLVPVQFLGDMPLPTQRSRMSLYLPTRKSAAFMSCRVGGLVLNSPIRALINPAESISSSKLREESSLIVIDFSFSLSSSLTVMRQSAALSLEKDSRQCQFCPPARYRMMSGTWPMSTGKFSFFSSSDQNQRTAPWLGLNVLFSKYGPTITCTMQVLNFVGSSNPSRMSTTRMQDFCGTTGAGLCGNQNLSGRAAVRGLTVGVPLILQSSRPIKCEPSLLPQSTMLVAQNLDQSLPLRGGPYMLAQQGSLPLALFCSQKSAKSRTATPISSSRASLLQFQTSRKTYLHLLGMKVATCRLSFHSGFLLLQILELTFDPANLSTTQARMSQSRMLQGAKPSARYTQTSRRYSTRVTFLSATMASIVESGDFMQLLSWMACLSSGPRRVIEASTYPVTPSFSLMGSARANQVLQNSWLRLKQIDVQSKMQCPMTASRRSRDFLSTTKISMSRLRSWSMVSALKKRLNLLSKMGLFVPGRTSVRLDCPLARISTKASQYDFSASNRKQLSFLLTNSEASRIFTMSLQSPSTMLYPLISSASSCFTSGLSNSSTSRFKRSDSRLILNVGQTAGYKFPKKTEIKKGLFCSWLYFYRPQAEKSRNAWPLTDKGLDQKQMLVIIYWSILSFSAAQQGPDLLQVDLPVGTHVALPRQSVALLPAQLHSHFPEALLQQVEVGKARFARVDHLEQLGEEGLSPLLAGAGVYPGENAPEVAFRVAGGVGSHVVGSELVGPDQLEVEGTELDDRADLEVSFDQVPVLVLVLHALEELAPPDSGVALGGLVDHDGVVAAEEGDDEALGGVVLDRTDHAGLEAQDVLVAGEHLDHVLLGGLGLQVVDAAHAVLLSAVAVVGRDDCAGLPALLGLGLQRLLLHPQAVREPPPGEVVAVVDEAVAAEDPDVVAADEVLGAVVVLLLEGHPGVVGHDVDFGQLHPAEEQGEGVPPAVRGAHLLHLHRVVGQEVVYHVVHQSALQRGVVPQGLEREHQSVILYVLVESAVGVSAALLHLEVLLVLLGVGGVNLQLLLLGVLFERVFGLFLRQAEGLPHVLVELPGEVVAVVEAEGALEEGHILAKSEVPPVEKGLGDPNAQGDARPLNEYALGDSGIFDPRLGHVDRGVRQVEVHEALPDPVVFKRALNNVLLEEALEAEDLAVVLEPGGLHPGHVLVGGLFADDAGLVDDVDEGALVHSVEEVAVEWLFEEPGFFEVGLVLELELLDLVVVELEGVGEGVPGEVGDRLGEVHLHSILFLWSLYNYELIDLPQGPRVFGVARQPPLPHLPLRKKVLQLPRLQTLPRQTQGPRPKQHAPAPLPRGPGCPRNRQLRRTHFVRTQTPAGGAGHRQPSHCLQATPVNRLLFMESKSVVRSIVISDAHANVSEAFLHPATKRSLKVIAGDPLSANKSHVFSTHAVLRLNQLLWEERAEFCIKDYRALTFLICETNKDNRFPERCLNFEGKLCLKARERPTSLKLIELFVNEVKVGTLTFRLDIVEQMEQANHVEQAVRKTVPLDQSSKLQLFSVKAVLNQTYFKLKGRAAQLRLSLGSQSQQTAVSRGRGLDPEWPKLNLKFALQQNLSLRLDLRLVGAKDEKGELVGRGEFPCELMVQQLKNVSQRIAIKDSKCRVVGHYLIDFLIVTHDQESQLTTEAQKNEKRRQARDRLKLILQSEQNSFHYSAKEMAVEPVSPRKINPGPLADNRSIFIPREVRFRSSSDAGDKSPLILRDMSFLDAKMFLPSRSAIKPGAAGKPSHS